MTQSVLPAHCRHGGGATFPMDVCGASWKNKAIYSCFFPASIFLSTGELWIATRDKKRKHNLIYAESQFWNDLKPCSKNLV